MRVSANLPPTDSRGTASAACDRSAVSPPRPLSAFTEPVSCGGGTRARRIDRLRWYFTFRVVPWTAGVIWALGWSMILMAGLVWLPLPAIGIVGLALIVLHNATDAAPVETFGALAW